MIDKLAKNLVKLKQDFVKVYQGTSHIQEVIPISTSDTFPIKEKHFEFLHLFAQKNPIYYNSFEQKISNVPCVIYEGDINKYWLSSLQHHSSRAPFSPTWILSAFISLLLTKSLEYKEVIDIGSGDGRIAYCAKVLGLNSFSIEIDDMLVELQNSISKSTGVEFNPHCSDAITFDYSSLRLIHPMFFIGGLAQMGGTALATGVLENLSSNHTLMKNTGMVFSGTYSKKYPSDPMSNAGWGSLINKYDLRLINTIILPTVWTFKESDDTPYIFTKTIPK
jgi:hypothetical protein